MRTDSRRILVAEDEPSSRLLVSTHLQEWGLEAVEVRTGSEAMEVLRARGAPDVAILDWMLPGVDGLELSRRIRAERGPDHPFYALILTGRDRKADLIEALDAGADDYLAKPFHPGELRARVEAGRRVVSLQRQLQLRVEELETAVARVKQLEGLLPICSYCKQIRDDREYWHRLEVYLGDRLDLRFTHGVCPDCLETRLNDQA